MNVRNCSIYEHRSQEAILPCYLPILIKFCNSTWFLVAIINEVIKAKGLCLPGQQGKRIYKSKSLYWFEVKVARNILLVLQDLEVDFNLSIDSQTPFYLGSNFSGCDIVVWKKTQVLDSDFWPLNLALLLLFYSHGQLI